MKKILCTLSMLLLNFSLLHANPIHKLYVFGDSLQDNGNLFHATAFTTPTPPYFQGRFSNGFVSSELLADSLGLTASYYKNLAFGGAMTSQKNVAAQVATITQTSPHTFNKHDLILLEAGANNFFFAIQTKPPYLNPYPQTIAPDLKKMITNLYTAGARNILLWSIPSLSKTPLAASIPAVLEDL